VYSTTAGGFLNFFTDGGALKNLKIVNEKWISDGTSNIAYVGGGEVAVGQTLAFQKISNVNQIKVDSNVVAEYTGPHERPLRKYPEVALTSASQDGYVVTASSQYDVAYAAYHTFNDVLQDIEAGAGGILWTSAVSTYPASGGFYVGTTYGIGTTYGEFVKLELPYKIKPKEVRIFPRTFQGGGAGNAQSPAQFKIFGSNDNFSSEIVELYHQNTDWVNNGTWGVFDISHTTHFKHFGIVFTKTNGSTVVGVQEIEYYGHEEGSASLDTTLKSVYNVPATTGTQLEVYYDAKDLTTMPATVSDLSPNSNGGTGTDVTVADGAFVFNGTSSLMEKTSLSIPGGDNPFTFSLWLKNDDFDSGYQYILRLGDNTTLYQTIALYKNSSNQIIFASWTLDFPIDYTFTSGQWNHISLVYPGGGWKQSNLIAYIDGRPYTFGGNVSSGGLGGSLMSLATSLTLRLGGFSAGNAHLDGSIANFRLYSKALNAGQVQELYDYQKDYFLGSRSSVTLYKGHLGVGVAEPSGQLELAGDARIQSFPPRGLERTPREVSDGITADEFVEGHGVFNVSASGGNNINANGPQFVFRRQSPFTAVTGNLNYWERSSVYNSSGAYTGNAKTAISGGGTLNGEWIQLSSPYGYYLKKTVLYHRYHSTAGNWERARMPKDFTFVGSNNGSSWSIIKSFGNISYEALKGKDLEIDSKNVYKDVRLIVHSIVAVNPDGVSGNETTLNIGQWRLFGTPGPTTLDKGSLSLGRSLDVPRISRYDVDTETPRPEKLVVDFDTTVNSSPTDISGKGNHGAFYGNAQYSAADKAFTGFPSSSSNYIKATLTGASGAYAHTQSYWINGADTTPRAAFTVGKDISTTREFLNMWFTTSTWTMNIDGFGFRYAETIDDNRWYHLAVTYDGGSVQNSYKFYVNGEYKTPTSVDNASSFNSLNLPSNPEVKIGQNNGTQWYNGMVSNPKIYSVALEPSEVKKLYNLGRTGRSMVISDTAVGIGKVPEAQLDVRGSARFAGGVMVGGNVGIGTASPSGKLQVYDDTNTRSLLNVREGSGTAARTEINTGIRFDTYSVESYGAGGSSAANHNYHILFNTNRKMALYYDGEDLTISWGGGGSYAARASVGSNAKFGFTFTGQHRNFIKDISYKEVIEKELGGLIVCANNNEYVKISDGIAKGSNAITQNEALPIVSLSLKALDKSCFGVISESEDPNSNRGGSMGMFKSYYDTEDGDKRIIINSVGEGAIWVTNINGSLESGDYITTSNVAGYGQKQDSEFLANYTVAKITMDCDFEPVTQSVQIIRKELSNVNYWVKTTYENVTEEEYSNLADENRQIVDDIYQEITKEESKTEQEGYELEVRQELVNVLDEHGQIQWEDDPSGATEKAYKIRYLDADGVETDEANAVHKAAFVGCTYHCG